MGLVGKFIDAVCDTHPPLMRAVLDKPLAPLEHWIHFDDSGQACGCLIGTAALAAGFATTRSEYDASVCQNGWDARAFVAELTGIESDVVDAVGYKVHAISARFAARALGLSRCLDGTPETDARTVHLLRQRIARQLAIRESAMGVPNGTLPNEPLERSPMDGARGTGAGVV